MKNETFFFKFKIYSEGWPDFARKFMMLLYPVFFFFTKNNLLHVIKFSTLRARLNVSKSFDKCLSCVYPGID